MYINFISVILPVYNSEKYLAESIKSTLRQTFSNFELIIINNASTDKSLNIIKSFCEIDKRIILIDQKTNLGMADSLNNGCKLAKGDWIARMDADDVARAVVYMASLPLESNVQFMTVMATKMPYIGRG